MEQLIYEIMGKKYLLFEIPVTDRSQVRVEKIIKKHKGIVQGAKVHPGGFWGTTYAELKVLIPEENAIEFNKDNE